MTEAEISTARRRPSPRQRRYRFALGFSAVLGGILGGWMVADQPAGRNGFETAFHGSLSVDFAIGASLFWVIGLAIAMIIYHRAIDDHEERAWLWAGLWGWYAFIFAAPVWWVLHRASISPAPDVMILFAASLITNCVAYLWLKFR